MDALQSEKVRTLLIITAKQVSQLGLETFYVQQWHHIHQSDHNREPRACFWKDLTEFIQSENSCRQNDVIVLMDDHSSDDNNAFALFLSDCQLLDLHDDPTYDPPPDT